MPKLFLLGDSTCAIKEECARPETGWGECFSKYLNPSFELCNMAKNGRSTEMIIHEGIFFDCFEACSSGDYVIIQFGHNDEKEDVERHTDPFTSYQDNLNYFIDVALKKGATPILISSIYRRQFIKEHELVKNTHGLYPKAMKQVAQKRKVIFIDMNKITYRWLKKIGDKNSKKYFMNFEANIYPNYPEGKSDNTHLRYEGARKICEFITQKIKKTKLKIIIK